LSLHGLTTPGYRQDIVEHLQSLLGGLLFGILYILDILTLGYRAGVCLAVTQVHWFTPGYRSGYRRALIEAPGWFTLWNAVPCV
jgi:hypothetical protein